MRESAIEDSIRKFAENNGCVFLKMAAVSGSNGKPDRLILREPGKMMFLEVKRPGETLEPLQVWWQKRLRAMGFICEWCDNAAKGKNLIHEHLL